MLAPSHEVLVTGGTAIWAGPSSGTRRAWAPTGHLRAPRPRLPGTAVDGDIRDRGPGQRGRGRLICARRRSSASGAGDRRTSTDQRRRRRNVIDVGIAADPAPRIHSSFLGAAGGERTSRRRRLSADQGVADRLADAAVAAGCQMVRVYRRALRPRIVHRRESGRRLSRTTSGHRLPADGPGAWSCARWTSAAGDGGGRTPVVSGRYAGGRERPAVARISDRFGADGTRRRGVFVRHRPRARACGKSSDRARRARS